MKKITNIMINTNGNKLRLADIFFNYKIDSIEFKSDEFDWNEISTIEKYELFKAQQSNTFDDSSIDGKYFLLMPGAIDPHVHFNTPGFEGREDFIHASTAAAWGGVTTIIDMPCTSIPPVTNLSNMNTKLNAVENMSIVDYAFWGGIRGDDFLSNINVEKEVQELSERGVAGFKVYALSGMNEFKDMSYNNMKRAARLVEGTGKPMAVHAEDKELVVSRRNISKQLNQNTWKDYCCARDEEAERVAVNELYKIAKTTNCRIHIVHLSSQKGMDIIREAKENGISLSSETCPHYLYFTQKNFVDDSIRNFLKTAPPVKHEHDKEDLWIGLEEGDLEFVTTDHAGCDPEVEKTSENFWEVYGGIPGVEHRVPFLFSEGFIKKRLTLQQTINYLSTNIADYFSLKSKGKIEKDFDADFTIVDLWSSQKILASNMHSKGKYTPFEGVDFNVVVDKTILRGELISDRESGVFGRNGYGKFIRV